MGIPRHPVMKRLKYSPEQVQIMILGLEMDGRGLSDCDTYAMK
jgi:hypothetical protein